MVSFNAAIDVAAPPASVAAVMFDPARQAEWMSAVQSVEMHDAALAPGARVTHRGSLMGRDLVWTTEVEAVHFPHLLALRITDGPFTGVVRYGIQRSGAGSRVEIQSAGELNGLSLVPADLAAGAMRSALEADLGRLKRLIEAAG
jgi:carbon monoxide dehydrogenase subunit G